ncbi:CinA family protein [Anaplasma marginale]|uniref:Competence / damage-inducible protein (CinA) n=1 Tax=Anaplasma marginale (strain Florida) TaxID=320483 RepID=B9KH75_ANAMF|nr:CinA family protein [Anaplasma marginale]ACM49779.1 competence / damage-inducible protein (cinA) [Anaplasma marginale str. Florida]
MLIPEALIAEAAVCIQRLQRQSLKVSFAESCTGGLLAFVFSCVPGVSSVLFSSVVTYATRSKHFLLGVPQQEIDKYGVVSEEIAGMMAENVLKTLEDVDIAVSITGIAGATAHFTNQAPAATEPETGVVHIGLAKRGSKVQTFRYDWNHLSRFEVQKAVVQKAIGLLTLAASSS